MIDTIVFDLGGVLIDWNPRYVYRQVFETESEVEAFLNDICTHDWNVQQDAGRSLQEATDLLVSQHPDWENEIRMYYGRWEEMLGGPIPGVVELLKDLKRRGTFRLYALTNWSAETFPVALARYEFLQLFEGIVVSGTEKCIKPDPKIYQILFERYQINPSTAVFLDDSAANVAGSEAVGMKAIRVESPYQLKRALVAFLQQH